jgi:hypothetical protein
MLVASGTFAVASAITSGQATGLLALTSLVIGVSGVAFVARGARDGQSKLE